METGGWRESTNVGLSTAQFSTYSYTTTPENFISAATESSDSAAVYPSTLAQTASYNNLNQLTNLTEQALNFDSNGNLLADGVRNYSWDAENRLIGITYPGQPGKQTAFTYDGLSRRTAITSTPAGGTATATSYIWCGSKICQARNASNSPVRGYYAEGEFVPGTPAQPYYYGPDQIGSVRRVFASASNAPAYSYDPYGSALQSTAPLTDFNYAGTFFNTDSGLYLTQYRVYDPIGGRWLSRDPLGEQSDAVANLYRYVGGNPVSFRDVSGLADDPCTGWGNPATLPDHFARHGADFGAKSPEDYARQASEFLKKSQTDGLPTKVDSSGTIRVYDPATNTFGSYNPDGTTKTFFKPSSPTYFDRQPGALVNYF